MEQMPVWVELGAHRGAYGHHRLPNRGGQAMTRDDVIRMAREAGFRSGNITLSAGEPIPFVAPLSATNCIVELENFAAIVAAAEREACAKVCDELFPPPRWAAGTVACANAIRARGQK